jgi:REP element-mobilizing transposase RayT
LIVFPVSRPIGHAEYCQTKDDNKKSKRRAEKRERIPPVSEVGHTPHMPDYRRNRVPGGTFFFTVNLLDRRSNLLVARIDALRDAVRQVRARAPFNINAWVVLPYHMHCLWTLPEGDANFPGRWRAINWVCKIVAHRRAAITAHDQPWRTRHLAAAVLGAHDPR